MKEKDVILIQNSHDNLISKEEAILKNESLGNSYLINEPSQISCFPNYLIGNIKCTYIINNEKLIGEGVGMLIGEDILITSAHNLIFSQLEDDNIINYKPHKITFHVLSNGSFELIEPINCEVKSVIFSKYFKDFKFAENQEFDNSNITSANQKMNKTSNVHRKSCNQNSTIDNQKIKNDDLNLNYLTSNNNFNEEYQSKSSDYTSQDKIKRKFSNKLIISNISEIPLEDDYAIIFTEGKIGIEIASILCEDENKSNENLMEIDQDTKIFKLFEDHIDFICELENLNETKFRNSKISMISGIKYNSNLLGVPQYVYGSTFNDFNCRYSKTKLEESKKNFHKENSSFIREEKKAEFSTRANLLKSVIINQSPSFTLDNISNHNDLDSSNITYKKRKREKELKYCLLINYDKNYAKKNIRNSKFENLRKLNNFNNEEFYSEGKTVQCEARGKLCSLFYENAKKLRRSSSIKNNCEFINPRYEVNNENTTPYFNGQINIKEENFKNEENSKQSILKNSDMIDDLSFLNLNENISFNKIEENKNSNTAFDYDCKQINFNNIIKENIEEILKCSFSQINENESKEELEKENSIKQDQNKYLASIDKNFASLGYSTNDQKQILKDSLLNLFINQSDLSRSSNKDKKPIKYFFDSFKKEDSTKPINTMQIDYMKTHVSEYLQRESIKSSIHNLENNYDNPSIELNYMITSYKGQSGSPIFIRIKNSKLKEMKKNKLINSYNDKYSYIFLGLHSRSPENFEPIIKPKSHFGLSKTIDENKIINSIQLDTNKNFNNINKTINININLNHDFSDLNINIDLKSLIEKHGVSVINEIKNIQDNSAYINYSDYKQIKKQSAIKEFLTKNNYSLYNIGLKINKNIFNKIKESIIFARNLRNSQKELDLNYHIEHKSITSCLPYNDSKNNLETKNFANSNLNPTNMDRSYILVNLYIHDEFVVKGIFNITSVINILFEIAAKYLEVDIKFILLKRKNENLDFENCKDEFILNIYDKTRKGNLGKKEHKCTANGIFREVINVKFTINIEKYSDLLKEKLISKLTDNIKSFDKNQIYENSDDCNLMIVIKYIFNEIQTFFEKSQTLYGLLFDAIKRKIIKSPQ